MSTDLRRPNGGMLPSAPHARSVEALAADLEADLEVGLATDEAEQRLEAFGPNQLRRIPGPPWWLRLLEQFRSPLVYLLAVAIVVSAIAWVLDGADGLPLDALVIAAIVIVNAAIGFVQERKAETAVAELQRMVTDTAKVIRDGEVLALPTTALVPGDLLDIGEGDTVPADARVVTAHTLSVAEAALTGESQPVHKSPAPVEPDAPLGDRTSMLFAATSVTTGHGRAVITGTGMATEVGDIAALLGETEEPTTPLERELDRVGKILGIAVVVIAAIVVLVALAVSGGVESAQEAVELLLIGVSLAVAAVPEGLPAVLSLVLAIGVRRMATRNAIVKRLAFAETLGSTTVVCTDKTGTLTRNEMTVRRLTTPAATYELTGTGYGSAGSVNVVDDARMGDGIEEASRALSMAVLASNADIHRTEDGWEAVGDPTEAALIAAAGKAGLDVPGLRSRFDRIGEIPFDSDRKRMTALLHDREQPDELLLVIKGAPDVVIPLCTVDHAAAGAADAGHGVRDWDAVVEGFGDEALRTLAVASRRLSGGETEGEIDDAIERDLTLLAVVGIMDPPRPEIAGAVRHAEAAGMRVIMITGDHPRTAARVAQEVGIADSDAALVTGTELDRVESLDAVAAEAAVFSRVAPRHKLQLVEALQRNGDVVAMTGDGVNDAPALKAADIGVAMGLTGSDVSKGAADMILTDDNFATIIAAVEEGRGIFSNIASFMRYLLSSNMGEVLTMFLGVTLATVIGLDVGSEGVVTPLLATQILWINLLTDTGPAIALGVDPVDPIVMERPPRKRNERLIDAEMMFTIGLLGLTMALATLIMLDAKLPGGLIEGTADIDYARTAAFTVLVIAQLFNAFNARSDRRSAFYRMGSNPWLIVTVALSFGLQVLVIHTPFLNEAFGVTPLSLEDWVLAAVLASSVLWVSELLKLILRRRGQTP